MKNVKDYKNKIVDCFKSIFNVYRFTFLVLFVMTLLVVIFGIDSKTIQSFLEVLFFYVIVVFTIETYVKDKTWKVIFYIVGLVFSILCHVFFTSHELFMFGVFSFLILVSLYKIVSDRKEEIDNYLWNVLQNELVFGVVSVILLFAFMFAAFIIHSLLVNSFTVDLYTRLSMLWFGIIFVPGQIVCLHYTQKDIFEAVKFIIRYIIYPLVVLITGVLYLYLIKILFTKELPSNLLYSFILWLVVVGLFVYVLLYRKEIGLSKKVLSVLPYLFTILVFVQIYCLFVRIHYYGITEMRYLGFIFILIEIVALVFIILDKFKWLKYILLVMSAFILIAFSIPFINMTSVSINNQVKRITSIYKEGSSFDDYSKEEKEQMVSAYWYLSRKQELGKLPNYVNVSAIRNYGGSEEGYRDLYYYNDAREIPIDGYKFFMEVVMDESFTEGIEASALSYDMFHGIDGLEDGIRVFLEKCMKNGEVLEKNIHFKDSSSYYVKRLSLLYDEESLKIKSVYMDGYLLKH